MYNCSYKLIKMKYKKGRKIPLIGENSESRISKFRKRYLKKGFELINITTLCEFKLGTSGWCNDINDPGETIHHIQVWYRNEQIAVFGSDICYTIDRDKYVIYKEIDDPICNDFIILKVCKK